MCDDPYLPIYSWNNEVKAWLDQFGQTEEEFKEFCFQQKEKEKKMEEATQLTLPGIATKQEILEQEYVKATELSPEERPGVLLKAARLRADMTQKQLAEKLATSRKTIYSWEKNKRKIPVETAKKLAEILNTSSEYFV